MAYYYFSVQFRESLEIAKDLFPSDVMLERLHSEECDTSNLSPYPGVAEPDERMNHDEFMRRVIVLARLDLSTKTRLTEAGHDYLAKTRALPPLTRALGIASYEDGGLEDVFQAILLAPDWDHPALAAFRHFLVEHIRFDSDVDAGHGALARHLAPDDRVLPLWEAFESLFLAFVPALAGQERHAA